MPPDEWNGSRWKPTENDGHYESWFLRGNAGDRAFWIRYTLFAPAGRPEATVGELWAIWFERGGTITAVKSVVPIAQCSISGERLAVRIGDATLDERSLIGRAQANGHTIAWDLTYGGGQPPVLLYPRRLYTTPLPRAKTVIPQPLAKFTGSITVDGVRQPIDAWLGSQNHNWGPRHTHRYAWSQVCGFDEAPDAFLECSTAQLKIGPIVTPPMSPVVMRLGGETLSWTGWVRVVRALGAYKPYEWHLESTGPAGTIDIAVRADATEFVALRYPDPPGGHKICLNSKLAHCEVMLRRPNTAPQVFHSSRAAFEILDDTAPPGVTPVV
jgi:hypothetical protein